MFEHNENHEPYSDLNRSDLRSDCAKCFGLCCVTLYFSSSEGFPVDKAAGHPCLNLQADYRCSIHENLWERGLKGCMAYDCFGAGQKVSQVSFAGNDWRKAPEFAQQMFEVFMVMRQLHELLWYLTEALTLHPACTIHGELKSMLDETEQLTQLSPDALVSFDTAKHREKVNDLLVKASELVHAKVSRANGTHSGRSKTRRGADLIGADLRKTDLRGVNLRSALLIAADLRGNDLCGADFTGADFRDADLRGADLSHSIFLTQAQLNTAKGDSNTKLPLSLTRPAHWDT